MSLSGYFHIMLKPQLHKPYHLYKILILSIPAVICRCYCILIFFNVGTSDCNLELVAFLSSVAYVNPDSHLGVNMSYSKNLLYNTIAEF